MLEANRSLPHSAMQAFKVTLSTSDEEKLNNELDSYAKELLSAMLFESDYITLRQMLSDREISPLLFQWALAVREGMNGNACVLQS